MRDAKGLTMRRHQLAPFAFVSSLLLAPSGIFGCSSSSSSDPCGESRCDSGNPKGPVHGLNAAGAVDITAAEAWPGRPAEPTPLSATEVAQACVAIGSCLDPSTKPAVLIGLCTGPDAFEERAN